MTTAYVQIDPDQNILNIASTTTDSNRKLRSPEKQKGDQAEDLFMRLLDKVSIPYMRIAQNLNDKSVTLRELETKRPDFVVNFPQVGTLLFDVKCRKKIRYYKSTEEYFQMDKEDMRKLFMLQQKILLPVWVAFLNETHISKIHEKETDYEFFIAPLTALNEFLSGIELNLKGTEFPKIFRVIIPDELLSTFNDQLNFKIGVGKISDKTIKKFADGYRAVLAKN